MRRRASAAGSAMSSGRKCPLTPFVTERKSASSPRRRQSAASPPPLKSSSSGCAPMNRIDRAMIALLLGLSAVAYRPSAPHTHAPLYLHLFTHTPHSPSPPHHNNPPTTPPLHNTPPP